tara:strand:+ start:653 stop:1891 length:1239 start_codon:yes stop_codon:yes gene_type:complete
MKIEIDNVKGFKDYLPKEAQLREKIVETAKKFYKLYGFLPLETPIIEYDEIMRSEALSNGEDEAVADRFRLKDRGGRNLGLRYEFTFQLAKLFKINPNIKLPFKRYQIGPNFRDEPIRAGRTRQFTQCDLDIIGDSSINADAECLAAVSDILKELKITGATIQINNRKLLNAIIESVQIKQSTQVLREIDKLEKIGMDAVRQNLKRYASVNQILTLFKLLEKPLSFFEQNSFDGASELRKLLDLCKTYKIKAQFTPNMVRGFAYYTGSIFEIVIGKTSIVAGGRYDNSVGRFINRKIPAVGVSFSLEALIGLCNEQLSTLKTDPFVKTLIVSINQDSEAIELAKKLRKSNVSTSLAFGQPGKQLEYANSLEIPYVIFIGEKEASAKKVKLKDMKSGSEKLLTEKQLLNKLAK